MLSQEKISVAKLDSIYSNYDLKWGDNDEESEVEKIDNFEDFLPKSSLYMTSKIVNDVEKKVSEFLKYDNTNLVKNAFHDNDFAKYLLRKLLPFSPLWSSFVHPPENNANVESHYKVVKKDLLRTTNGKPTRVIKELRVDLLAKLVKVHNSKCFKPYKKDKSCVEDVESFKGRPKPNITEFQQEKKVNFSRFF